MHSRRRKWFVAGTIFILFAVAAGVIWRVTAHRDTNIAFEEADVKVDISWENPTAQQMILKVRYTPVESGFHLYSKDMPLDGIDGLGRPTRLEIVDGFTADGVVSADKQAVDLRLQGLDTSFPVYPEGSVTLRLPIKASAGSGTIRVGYMACSLTRCMPPHEKTIDLLSPAP
ncbi:MAG: hypothetical protein ABI947_26865 [Chloroflexota bacterium]